MKKSIIVIPIAIVAIAIAGAFTTQAKNRNSFALVQGYIKGNPQGTACQISIWCSNTGNQLCMVGTTQVWGKNANGQCVLEVYKAPE